MTNDENPLTSQAEVQPAPGRSDDWYQGHAHAWSEVASAFGKTSITIEELRALHAASSRRLSMTLDEVIKEHTLKVLEHENNISKTCRTLGINRRTIYRWFSRWSWHPKDVVE